MITHAHWLTILCTEKRCGFTNYPFAGIIHLKPMAKLLLLFKLKFADTLLVLKEEVTTPGR